MTDSRSTPSEPWYRARDIGARIGRKLPQRLQAGLTAGAARLRRAASGADGAPLSRLATWVGRTFVSDAASPREYFTAYYEGNLWRGSRSRSGPGSEGAFAKEKVSLLDELVDRHQLRSILDLGCGDFFWMQEVAASLQRYHGVDVVESLIADNRDRYGSPNITFECLDVAADQAAAADEAIDVGEAFDLVVCFDVLGHLLNDEVDRALAFILEPGRAKYLLVTNRRDEHSELYLSRPKTRREGINVEKHPRFVERGLAPIWQKKAQHPGDFFELYELAGR